MVLAQGCSWEQRRDQSLWLGTMEMTCYALCVVERKDVPNSTLLAICSTLSRPAELTAAHLNLGGKKSIKGGKCKPVARSTRDAAHRVSDSIELNNPRGSGEGHGRTFSPEGSEDELLQAWFHGGRHKGVVSGVLFPSYQIPWFPRFPRGKGADPDHPNKL